MRRRQPRKQAKTLTESQLRALIDYASKSEHGLRDQVMILLTYRAGLRASEVASADWSIFTDARGKLKDDYFTIVGKNNRRRTIPIHPELLDALYELKRSWKHRDTNRLMYASRGGAMSANHVTVHLWYIYRDAGFQGASSHSGRRTMITALARTANNHDCSIKDVQQLVGHARIETTQLYIEPSNSIRRLVRSL